MVQIHSPRPILLEPMSYSNQKSQRPLGRGPRSLVVQIHSLCSCSCSHFQIGRRFEFPSIPSNNEDLDGSSKPKPAFSAMSFAKRRLRLVEVRRITNWRFSSPKTAGL